MSMSYRETLEGWTSSFWNVSRWWSFIDILGLILLLKIFGRFRPFLKNMSREVTILSFLKMSIILLPSSCRWRFLPLTYWENESVYLTFNCIRTRKDNHKKIETDFFLRHEMHLQLLNNIMNWTVVKMPRFYWQKRLYSLWIALRWVGGLGN